MEKSFCMVRTKAYLPCYPNSNKLLTGAQEKKQNCDLQYVPGEKPLPPIPYGHLTISFREDVL